MTNKLKLIAAVFTLLVATAALATGKIVGVQEVKIPEWWKLSFLDIAMDAEEAADEGKHLILFFHLDGCPYCAKMAAENFNSSPYIDFLKSNFDVVEINTRGERELSRADGSTMLEKQYARELGIFYTPALLFLDGTAETIVRVDGYRSDAQFEPILRYVASEAYRDQDIQEFIAADKRAQAPSYQLLEHELFGQSSDLSALDDKPIALIFEDSSCADCRKFHEQFLDDEITREIMAGMHVLRWDADSSQPVRDHRRQTTTPKELAQELELMYRPAVVLIADGRVIDVFNSQLVLYHFHSGLDYVASGAYKAMSRREFGRDYREKYLLRRNVDYSI